jgi:hypothetical protein
MPSVLSCYVQFAKKVYNIESAATFFKKGKKILLLNLKKYKIILVSELALMYNVCFQID